MKQKFWICLVLAVVTYASNCAHAQTKSWVTESSGNYIPRQHLTSAVVDGKIYVMGGENDTSNELAVLEVFDPATNTWSTPVTTGTLTPRKSPASAVVNNKIYVIGGENQNGPLNTLEVFDPATNVWSTPATSGDFYPRVGCRRSH